MSLLPPPPATNAHVVDVANANKASNLAFVRSAAAQVEANIRQCWDDPEHTAQEFLDQYGTSAAAAMEMSRALTLIVLQYQAAAGIVLLKQEVLALAGDWRANEDGTVTVLA